MMRTVLTCFALVVAVVAVYAQVHSHSFVNFDDETYIYENPFVKQGLTLDGVTWALRTFTQANWHPLMWISLMIDSQIYGTWAGGFLITNFVLHAINSVVLFLLLRR